MTPVANNNDGWLRRATANFLVSEANTKAPLETGGILMGYFAKSENSPVILWATGPGPRAIHLREYYRPDQKHDQMQIADLYERFGRRLTYLGDWHTHPAPLRHLSGRDRRTLRRIARCRSARVSAPIMLILAFDDMWCPTIWQGSLSSNRLWRKRLAVTERRVNLF